MKILGIETSCDETAAAVVEDGVRLYSNVVSSQMDDFAKYGGVIPEIAARSHIEIMLPIVQKALDQAGCSWDDIDGIGVTYAPGLVGSLLIGSITARTLAHLKHKPLYPVHHVEGHVYANFLTELASHALSGSESQSTSSSAIEDPGIKNQVAKNDLSTLILPKTQPKFPLLALIVSGGHTQLVLFKAHGDYVLLGQAQDDAVGEAFDKVAKIIGLPYPGGISISKLAPSGDSKAFPFPKAKLPCPPNCLHAINTAISADHDPKDIRRGGRGEIFARNRCHKYDFSFSGLKTAVLRTVQKECGVDHTFASQKLPERVSDRLRANIAASFQRVAIETLVEKTVLATRDYPPASVVIAGGVAANLELRRQLSQALPAPIEYAPISLCTDNAAMIASLAYFMAQSVEPTDPLTLEVVPALSMTRTQWQKHPALSN